jgi:tetratricopeptide (TPR) repeat protein
MHAAAGLLQRAGALLPADDAQRVELLPDLAETLIGLGQFDNARSILSEARIQADRLSKPRISGASRLMEMFLRLYSGEWGQGADAMLSSIEILIKSLEAEDAHSELATAWRLIILVHGTAGRYTQAAEAAERAMAHARMSGNDRLVAKVGGILAINAFHAPIPVPQAIEQCEKLLSDGFSDRVVECNVMCILAALKAMSGELDAARVHYQQGRAVLRDLGQGHYAASTGIELARVELLGGDLKLAEHEVRADMEFLAAKGETYFLSTMAALLARIVRDQGRDDEALELLITAERATAEDDVESQALWRAIRAPILARQGRHDHAETLARTAVELTLTTEAPNMQADAMLELASVLSTAGKIAEARISVTGALERYSYKGNIIGAKAAQVFADQMAAL